MDEEAKGVLIQQNNVDTFNQLVAISRKLPPEEKENLLGAMEQIDDILSAYATVGFLALGLMASHMILEMGREALDTAIREEDGDAQ